MTAKLLFVAHVLPFPENTGTNIRLANLLRAACAAGPVKFIGFIDMGPAHDPEEGMRQLRALCPDAELIPRQHGWWPHVERDSLKWALRHYVLAPGAFVFREFACEALVDAVRRHAADADVIWVGRLWIAHHLRDLGRKMIVDLDDIESVKIGRRMKGWKLTAPVVAAWYDWWKTRRAERRALQVFQRAVVCSEEDTRFWPGQRDRVWSAAGDLCRHAFLLAQCGRRTDVREESHAPAARTFSQPRVLDCGPGAP